MKTIFSYFRQRRERKLRQWCIEQSPKTMGEFSAQDIYDWVALKTGRIAFKESIQVRLIKDKKTSKLGIYANQIYLRGEFILQNSGQY